MKKTFLIVFMLAISITYSLKAQSDAKAKFLINQLEAVNGGRKNLSSKKDVEFVYVYRDMAKGVDVSKERLIFDGEHSFGEYFLHEVNVLPTSEGKVTQSLINGNIRVELNGKEINSKPAIQLGDFLRRVNFFWFSMMYKLNDDAVIAKHIGKEQVNNIQYDKVSITYDSNKTGKPSNDEYILYFNPTTHLVDLFYFSLPAFGVYKPVLKMELTYSVIDGVYVATTRKGIFPDNKGEYKLAGIYESINVKFNNNFKIENNKIK